MTDSPENSSGLLLAGRFTWVLLAVSLLLCGAAYGWGGIDFLAGVALGCAIVGTNYLWTKMVVRRALISHDLKARVLLAYVFKFGLTVAVLFLAILRFDVDPLAILVGVTSLVAATVALVLSGLSAS